MKHERQNSVVHLMDCIEGMKQYPDKWFDLAVVDSPYGININVNMGRRKGDKKSDYHKFAGEDKEAPDIEYFEELLRVSKNQIIWGANYMIQRMSAAGFDTNTPCWILWDKGFSPDVTFAQFEMAWTSFKSSAKKFDFNAAANRDRIHPTQKPVALYDWIFHNYAKPDFKILDTHLGSQSSRIAAHKHGLDFTAFELDSEYFEKGNKRFDDFISQTTIFDML
jgi:site-specific DNA-methyltransferase (adenine-specific)